MQGTNQRGDALALGPVALVYGSVLCTCHFSLSIEEESLAVSSSRACANTG